MTDASRAEDALLRLKQYRREGERAPHKPLLVLLALARLAETGSSELAWDETAARLGELIAEFGPPSRTGRLQSAAYPFTHLRSDSVWVLSEDVPMDGVAPLSERRVTGRLTSVIEDALRREPGRLQSVARRIVDLQFPTTLAPDVLLAVGLDPEYVERTEAGALPPSSHRRRSAEWRAQVLAGWDSACAFCGYDGSVAGAPVGIEAAHVRWFNFDGPDALDNGLALCSLHHKLFDRGVLGLSDDHEVQVSGSFRAVGTGRAVYNLHGLLLRPRRGTPLPAGEHVGWHRRQVFLGQPLTA